MPYYSISRDHKLLFLQSEGAFDSTIVWRLKYWGWSWDAEGRRWYCEYDGYVPDYIKEMCSIKRPAFIVSAGSYCGFWGNNLKWTLNNRGWLRIYGKGDCPGYNYDQIEDLPWYRLRNRIISITVETGITGIGKRVFYNLPNLETVTLQDSVTSIGERSFSRCVKLRSIRFSQNLISIGQLAFQDCISLDEIHIPESVSNIGSECFKNWTSNQKIYKIIKDAATGQRKEILYSSQQINSKSVTDIYFEDFVVITDNSHCVNSNHAFEDIRARINILQRNGELRTITIPAGHCKTCNQYYIRISQFENLRNIGIILCRMVHEKYVSSKRSGNFYDTLSHESWLKQYGYSTNSQSNLTDVQRRQILICLMESDPSSRQRIVNHLNWLIQQHKNQVNMLSAVAKWTSDRVFVENYKIGSTRVVAMKSLKIRHYANK